MIAFSRIGPILCHSRHLSTVDSDRACQLVKRLNQKGRKMLLKALQQGPKYKIKSHKRDLVSETDRAMERMFIGGIKKAFPEHKIIAEEGTEGKNQIISDAPTWIIDPIDGTTNFVHAFPHFCTSIALYVEKQGEFGWIDNPLLRHSYVVQRGRGVFLNGQPVRVSGQRDLKKSLICMYWGWSIGKDGLVVPNENIFNLQAQVHGIRCLGSAALQLTQVAIGACDAYLQLGSHVWDWAAGTLMVQEAGGVVVDPCGGDFDIYSRRILAAATPELAAQIVPLVTQYFPHPRDDELNGK